MKHVNYIEERDELEVILKESDAPKVVTLDNNIALEFDDDDDLSAIVMPNFMQMMRVPLPPDSQFVYEGVSFHDKDMILTIKLNEQKINIKCDLSGLEN